MNRPQPRSGGYSSREIVALCGLSPAQIRGYVRAGVVTPEPGPGGEYFSFQDLILLKTAKALLDARISRQRIHAALKNLREQLPAERPLSGVRIAALGKRVVVRDGTELWNPESGQSLLDFEVDVPARPSATLSLPAKRSAAPLPAAEPGSAEEWFLSGVDFEGEEETAEAAAAYARALALDPGMAEAHLNLGRLLHEAGQAGEAESHYRQALAAPPDPYTAATAAFNLGVALQDQERLREAVDAYELALERDPSLLDAHFNLAGVHEALGELMLAFQHLKSCRPARN